MKFTAILACIGCRCLLHQPRTIEQEWPRVLLRELIARASHY